MYRSLTYRYSRLKISVSHTNKVAGVCNFPDCTGTARAPDNSDHGVNNFWTSGKRKQNECTSPFHWVPSDSFTQALGYTNWCDGEPNCHFPAENCIALARVHCSGFRWNDMICSWPLCSVCEVVRFG